jgi:hypothetical protein
MSRRESHVNEANATDEIIAAEGLELTKAEKSKSLSAHACLLATGGSSFSSNRYARRSSISGVTTAIADSPALPAKRREQGQSR